MRLSLLCIEWRLSHAGDTLQVYQSRIALFSHVKPHLKMIPTNRCFYQSINFRNWEKKWKEKCSDGFFTTFNKTLPQNRCNCFNPFELNIRFEVDRKRFGVKFFKRNEKTIILSIISDSSKTTKEINSRHFREWAERKPRKNDLEIFMLSIRLLEDFKGVMVMCDGDSFFFLNNWIPKRNFNILSLTSMIYLVIWCHRNSPQ